MSEPETPKKAGISTISWLILLILGAFLIIQGYDWFAKLDFWENLT